MSSCKYHTVMYTCQDITYITEYCKKSGAVNDLDIPRHCKNKIMTI